ncbi:MAG: hypothetical protein R3E64_09520 [Halioglobus sp.]
MNWDAIGASGEVAGALLVIVSVIYLARQIQQNTATSRAEVLSAFSIGISQQYDTWGSDSRTSELFHKMVYEGVRRSELPNADKQSLSFLLLSRVYLFDAAYRSYREGILKEHEFLSLMNSRIWELPFLLDSWPIYTRELSPDFVEYMENRFESLRQSSAA